MSAIKTQDQNVFDLMVPSSQSWPSEDEILRAKAPLVINFVGLLVKHATEGELFGLVEKFEAKSLIDKLQSWIGRGTNLSISTDEVQEVLGDEFLNELRQKLVEIEYIKSDDPKERLLESISEVFPFVVRRFARAGQIPPQRILVRSVADFQKSLLR